MSLFVENLQFSYDSQELQLRENHLLDNVSFDIASGGIMQLKGNNGSGKTTLLRIISGLLTPNSGTISFAGNLINDREYQNSICYVGHKLGLNLQLTVLENCYYFLKNNKTKAETLQLLKTFGLDNFKDKFVSYLSAGQKKRLSLLRVLLQDSKLWILDEPFTALDKDFVELFVRYMQMHVMQNGLILYTSHQAVSVDANIHSEYSL